MASLTPVPSTAAAVSWPGSGSPPPATSDARAASTAPAAAAGNPATTPPGAPAAGPPATTPTPEQLGNIVSKLQTQVGAAAADLQFSVDHDTGKSVVKVLEKATKTVIWQFPSEQALQVSKDIERFQKGFMVNQQA